MTTYTDIHRGRISCERQLLEGYRRNTSSSWRKCWQCSLPSSCHCFWSGAPFETHHWRNQGDKRLKIVAQLQPTILLAVASGEVANAVFRWHAVIAANAAAADPDAGIPQWGKDLTEKSTECRELSELSRSSCEILSPAQPPPRCFLSWRAPKFVSDSQRGSWHWFSITQTLMWMRSSLLSP